MLENWLHGHFVAHSESLWDFPHALFRCNVHCSSAAADAVGLGFAIMTGALGVTKLNHIQTGQSAQHIRLCVGTFLSIFLDLYLLHNFLIAIKN